MQQLEGLYIFILGLIFGSFALALADRLKAKKDWVKGRSSCEHCNHTLAARDLIPLASWLSTGGSCRYCRKRLSASYPLTELGLGLAFLISYLYFPFELSSWGWALLVLWMSGLVLMCSLFVFDLRWYTLPSRLVYTLVSISSVHWLVFALLYSDRSFGFLLLSLVGALLASAGVFFVLHLVSDGKWIGDGDVRLGLAIGLFLVGPIEAWLAVFFASTLGIIVVLPTLKKTKKRFQTKVPYGPLLITGLWITYLFGTKLIEWYSSTFLYL
ncbi:prepilin peptidase [Candidatus Saccharibacteria bacterium]|nr:prepilin peptidase [Candidatus Saccharibacteria bacterium]